MKIKFILFILFIFIFTSCSTSKKNIDNVNTGVVDTTNIDSDKDGVVDYSDELTSSPTPTTSSPTPTKPNVTDISAGVSEEFIRKNFGRKLNKSTKNTKVKPLRDIEVSCGKENRYSNGLIAYKLPKYMAVGGNYLVKVRITKEDNRTMLIVGDRNIPIDDDSSNSIVNVENISISPVMSAVLTTQDGHFIIDTLSSKYQHIDDRGYTEWSWNLKPIKSGDNILKLCVKVRVKEDGEVSYRDIVVFDKKIKIESNYWFLIKFWFDKNWQWFFVIILIPLIKWLYEKRNKEVKNKEV